MRTIVIGMRIKELGMEIKIKKLGMRTRIVSNDRNETIKNKYYLL